MKQLAVLSIAAVLIPVFGCVGPAPLTTPQRVQLYQGPARPEAEEVVLFVPATVSIKAINHRSMALSGGQLLGTGMECHLLPGTYYITARFVMLFDTFGGEDHEKVYSRYTTLTLDGKAGDVYELSHDPAETLREAREVARNPNFRLDRLVPPPEQ